MQISTKKYIDTYLENIVALMPGHVYWKDLDGVYLGCNDLQAKSLGFLSRKEIVGKTDYDLSPKDKADAFRKIDLEVMSTGISHTIEEIIILTNGSEATVLSQKVPLYNDEGNIIGIVGISIDITARKNAEEALRKQIIKTEQISRSRVEFLTVMSHEIKSPMGDVSALAGYLKELVSDGADRSEILHYLEDIQNVANSALPKINQVKRILDLELEGIHSELAITNPELLINKVVSDYPADNNVKYNININNSIPKNILLDPRHLYEVLSIVVRNAVRFTEQGTITITLDMLDNNQGEFLSITVQDTGKGISAEQLDVLFKTFLMGNEDPSYRLRYRVPSLNLSYAKKVIELLGGDLTITSQLEKGTSVNILIPFRTSEDISNKKNTKKSAKNKITTSKVLLVDDMPITRDIESKILQKIGYKVDTAATGKEAVKLALDNDYEVIFMDISLPDINGVETARQIRKKKATKIVAVTSHTFEDDIDNFLSDGFITVLSKPVTKDQFEYCLATLKKSEDNINE